MHIDHVKLWSKYPELRYDAENLQVLCRECHAWKEAQGIELNFRPDMPQKT
jgi:5-methylcytosine-specific restriction endonuclease McrA